MEMSSKMKKNPSIRFKGFTDAWEQRKLGEVFFQTSKYVNPKESNLELWSLTVENGLTPKTERYNREFLVKKEDQFKSVDHNEFIYNPMNMTLGAVDLNLTGKTVAVSGYYITMLSKDGFDSKYFSIWLKSPLAIKMYKLYATGSLIERQRVQFPTLSQIKSSVPQIEEQTKIGSFFKQLDDTIALHQRQLDNYKQLKKSMKQKIFDQKLRFKDADGNDYPKWKRRTLGKISEIIMGQSPDSANFTSNEQDTVLIQGNADLNGGKITPRIYTTQITKTCEAGDIILTVRAPVGDLAIANTRACIGRGVCAIKGDLYIYQYLEMIRDTDGWRKIIQGSTFESINSNDVKDLPIDVPSSEERKKIAEFFKALDRRIEKSTQRVESMKQFRKGLMQQMFVE